MNFLGVVLITALAIPLESAAMSPSGHRYNIGDHVPLFVNKVGPLHNPSETYQYYELPFCRPDPVIAKKETLGEVLNGDRLMGSLYKLNFRENSAKNILCVKRLSQDQVARFRNAVFNDFYFQMYYDDDLPLWGFIGKTEEQTWMPDEEKIKYYLFKHVRFDVLYNDNRVIEISAFSDPDYAVDITEDVDMDVTFTYSVFWNATSALFETRMDRYSRAALHPMNQKIHWFSFINSVVITLLLMALLTVFFMQHLKNDLRKCSSGDEEEEREIGWKHIHGDAFTYPQNMSLFCAILGTGTQLLTLIFLLFVLAFVGLLYPYNRGALWTSLVLVYTLTSVVGGYSAASFHCHFAKTGWKRSVLLTSILYPGPLFVLLSILNTISISYGVTAALPFGTIVVVILIYVLLAIPLLAMGGVVGYHFRSEFQAPSTKNRYRREIPLLRWYTRTPCQMFLQGLVPFSAIVLELRQLNASLWGHKICTLPGSFFVIFLILVLVVAILSVGMTYIQLSMEDHNWWWRSVLCGGSPAIFMFGYCVYFFTRSPMSGLMQLSFFIAYSACICYALCLVLSAISFRASFIFVRQLFHAVKSE